MSLDSSFGGVSDTGSPGVSRQSSGLSDSALLPQSPRGDAGRPPLVADAVTDDVLSAEVAEAISDAISAAVSSGRSPKDILAALARCVRHSRRTDGSTHADTACLLVLHIMKGPCALLSRCFRSPKKKP